MVFRVRPTPTLFPINIPYTPLDNKPSDTTLEMMGAQFVTQDLVFRHMLIARS